MSTQSKEKICDWCNGTGLIPADNFAGVNPCLRCNSAQKNLESAMEALRVDIEKTDKLLRSIPDKCPECGSPRNRIHWAELPDKMHIAFYDKCSSHLSFDDEGYQHHEQGECEKIVLRDKCASLEKDLKRALTINAAAELDIRDLQTGRDFVCNKLGCMSGMGGHTAAGEAIKQMQSELEMVKKERDNALALLVSFERDGDAFICEQFSHWDEEQNEAVKLWNTYFDATHSKIESFTATTSEYRAEFDTTIYDSKRKRK